MVQHAAIQGFVSGVFSELATEADIFRSRTRKPSFRATHVVILRGNIRNHCAPTAGFIVLSRQWSVFIVPVLLSSGTISYATLPSVEMETKKSEQRETAHMVYPPDVDGIQYMFSGAPQRLILAHTFFLRQLRHRIHHYLPPVRGTHLLSFSGSADYGLQRYRWYRRGAHHRSFLSRNTRSAAGRQIVVSLLGILLVTISTTP